MGVIEEVPKATDPTPQWPSRMRIGLIECEEGEKGCMIREIQALAHTCAYRKEKGGRRLPHIRTGTTHSSFQPHYVEGNRGASFGLLVVGAPPKGLLSLFYLLHSAFQVLQFKRKF